MDILHKMMFVKHFWQLFVFLLPTFMKIPRRNCVSLIGRTSSCLAWRSSQGANKPYPFEEQMRPSCHSIFSFVCPNPFLGYWQAPFFAPSRVFAPQGWRHAGRGFNQRATCAPVHCCAARLRYRAAPRFAPLFVGN